MQWTQASGTSSEDVLIQIQISVHTLLLSNDRVADFWVQCDGNNFSFSLHFHCVGSTISQVISKVEFMTIKNAIVATKPRRISKMEQ